MVFVVGVEVEGVRKDELGVVVVEVDWVGRLSYAVTSVVASVRFDDSIGGVECDARDVVEYRLLGCRCRCRCRYVDILLGVRLYSLSSLTLLRSHEIQSNRNQKNQINPNPNHITSHPPPSISPSHLHRTTPPSLSPNVMRRPTRHPRHSSSHSRHHRPSLSLPPPLSLPLTHSLHSSSSS